VELGEVGILDKLFKFEVEFLVSCLWGGDFVKIQIFWVFLGIFGKYIKMEQHFCGAAAILNVGG
jgi:hypothetical protein